MKSGQRKKPKSVRRAELAAAMGGLIPGHEFFPPPAREALQAAGNAKPGESVFDRIKLWDEVNGNADLLRKLATLYFEETPRLLQKIGDGVRTGDAEMLERAAHTLKGSLAQLRATNAMEMARQLEDMGRRHDLAAAAQALGRLEHGVAIFDQQLRTWIGEF